MEALMQRNIAVKPSMFLTIFVAFIHIGGLFCVLFLSLPIPVNIALIIFICSSLYLTLWNFTLLKSSKAINAIALINAEQNVWQLSTNAKEILQGRLKHSSYSSGYLMTLNFDLPQRRGKLKLILFKDSVSEDDWRQLRVVLANYFK